MSGSGITTVDARLNDGRPALAELGAAIAEVDAWAGGRWALAGEVQSTRRQAVTLRPGAVIRHGGGWAVVVKVRHDALTGGECPGTTKYTVADADGRLTRAEVPSAQMVDVRGDVRIDPDTLADWLPAAAERRRMQTERTADGPLFPAFRTGVAADSPRQVAAEVQGDCLAWDVVNPETGEVKSIRLGLEQWDALAEHVERQRQAGR